MRHFLRHFFLLVVGIWVVISPNLHHFEAECHEERHQDGVVELHSAQNHTHSTTHQTTQEDEQDSKSMAAHHHRAPCCSSSVLTLLGEPFEIRSFIFASVYGWQVSINHLSPALETPFQPPRNA